MAVIEISRRLCVWVLVLFVLQQQQRAAHCEVGRCCRVEMYTHVNIKARFTMAGKPGRKVHKIMIGALEEKYSVQLFGVLLRRIMY